MRQAVVFGHSAAKAVAYGGSPVLKIKHKMVICKDDRFCYFILEIFAKFDSVKF